MAPFSKSNAAPIGAERLVSEGAGITAKPRRPQGPPAEKAVLRRQTLRGPPNIASGRSGFLVGGDIAVDEVADVVVVFLFLLQERILGLVVLGVLLDVEVVDGRFGDLLLGRLDLVERDHVDAGGRRELALLFLRLCGRPRPRRALKHGPAFRADDRILVEIEEFGAAVLALMFASEFGFGQGDLFPVVEDGISAGSVSHAPQPLSMRHMDRRSTVSSAGDTSAVPYAGAARAG